MKFQFPFQNFLVDTVHLTILCILSPVIQIMALALKVVYGIKKKQP